MHEIDFEFINAWPASSPGGIWTNSFINGLTQLEQLWMPWDLIARTGHKTFDTFQASAAAAHIKSAAPCAAGFDGPPSWLPWAAC
jgi:hypothetical protein